MTALEQRIAEAIKEACPTWQTRMYDSDAEAAARAVVAVLPITSECPECESEGPPWFVHDDGEEPRYCHNTWHDIDAETRALLDAQAAAHAAEVGDGCQCLHCEKRPEWLEPNSHSREKCVRCGWVMGSPPLNCQNDDTPHRFASTEAEVEALRAEVERLTRVARGEREALVNEIRQHDTAIAERDRAVAEALEHAAQKLASMRYHDSAAIVRGLIPKEDEQ